MTDSGDILSLLGIPSDKVAFIDGFHIDGNEDKIIISLIDERPSCPFCRSKNVVIHDYYKVNINNSIIKTRLMHVEIDMRRYKCKDCKKSFKQSFSFYKPGESISQVTKIAILDELKETVSYSYVARQYGVSTNAVINYFDALPRQQRLQLPNVICVDEFHFSNRKNPKLKFPFVISNPFTGEIIEIIESRKWDYLRDYFNKVSLYERSKVKYFISDMNETYRTLKNTFFRDSVHIVDHFHVMRLFNNAIQKIRTKIMKSNDDDSYEYRFLKKHWKMFVCNRSRLKKFKKTDYSNIEDCCYISDEKDIEMDYIKGEQNFLIHQALKALKAEYAQILYLIYFEELSNSEAAEIVGKSPKQISDLIYCAKKSLKAELERRGKDGQI